MNDLSGEFYLILTPPRRAVQRHKPMNNGNDVGGLRVARPRLVGARRSMPGRFNVGDECIAEFPPGLLRFLSLAEAAGRPLSAGAALP